eukprot:CAMPEP_0197522002 /NCGR_PEP_ID=MMETSP1318-20131121/7207_1 /TAXON_ID=552666 /ORGANISM="Partenskyella glossopodia, Strain RCC365" /LENGTH=389 /DNA_ID=CAMNT_0043074209 /DNA_START=226 /DNA_END=1395 /DNA_ORIENTATION=+
MYDLTGEALLKELDQNDEDEDEFGEDDGGLDDRLESSMKFNRNRNRNQRAPSSLKENKRSSFMPDSHDTLIWDRKTGSQSEASEKSISGSSLPEALSPQNKTDMNADGRASTQNRPGMHFYNRGWRFLKADPDHNNETGLRWIQKSADMGYGRASLLLGILKLHESKKTDIPIHHKISLQREAYIWFRLASSYGYRSAKPQYMRMERKDANFRQAMQANEDSHLAISKMLHQLKIKNEEIQSITPPSLTGPDAVISNVPMWMENLPKDISGAFQLYFVSVKGSLFDDDQFDKEKLRKMELLEFAARIDDKEIWDTVKGSELLAAQNPNIIALRMIESLNAILESKELVELEEERWKMRREETHDLTEEAHGFKGVVKGIAGKLGKVFQL